MISRHARSDGGWFSASVEEELKAFLLAAAWETAQRFQPKDDGRGSNRLAGWVVWVLHRRVVDFLRREFGSTRNGDDRIETVPFDEDAHAGATYDDYEHDNNGRHLDRSQLSARALDELAVLELVVEEGSTLTAVSRQLGFSSTLSLAALRREARVIAE